MTLDVAQAYPSLRMHPCTCTGCTVKDNVQRISRAIVEGQVYASSLRKALGIGEEGKSSLALEKERIREM